MRCVARIPVVSLLILATLGLVRQAPAQEPRIGSRVERRGDEIVVCGQLYHSTAPVVLWSDPRGIRRLSTGAEVRPPRRGEHATAREEGAGPGESLQPAAEGAVRAGGRARPGWRMGPPPPSEGRRPV